MQALTLLDVRKAVERICNKFKGSEELYDYCMDMGLYRDARNLVSSEISGVARNPKEYMESMGWDTSDITPELEECIELNLAFKPEDVLVVMEELGEEARRILEERPTTRLYEAIHEAMYEDDVSDALSNVIARRLLKAIEECKRKS